MAEYSQSNPRFSRKTATPSAHPQGGLTLAWGAVHFSNPIKAISLLEQKVWGDVQHCFNSPHCAVSILDTLKGGYSSRHYHAHRVNRFIVHSGEIEVVQYSPDGIEETGRNSLKAGEVLDVQPGNVHRFEVKEPGVLVEVYWPVDPDKSCAEEDIHRLDVGGRA